MRDQSQIHTWDELREFAHGLGLPHVTDAVSWGNATLKAHGKLWCWWSPYVEAALFKGTKEEREMLVEADPETFLTHPHYASSGLLLVAAGRIDKGWAEARLTQSWRDMAPKRVLAAWDEARNSG